MKIRLCSDLHLEFYPDGIDSYFFLPQMDSDSDTVLILAGDIVTVKKVSAYALFFNQINSRFKKVLFIPGNHEYYGGNLPSACKKISEALQSYKNILFAESFSTIIDGYTFIGATYWTSLNNTDPILMHQVCSRYGGLNDYRAIRNNGKLMPLHTVNLHLKHKNFILDCLKNVDPSKVIIFTHHAPTELSVVEKYKNDPLTYAYVNRDFDLVFDSNVPYWFHGHTHHTCDYMVNNTQVICNCAGYIPIGEKTGYNKQLLIEL